MDHFIKKCVIVFLGVTLVLTAGFTGGIVFGDIDFGGTAFGNTGYGDTVISDTTFGGSVSGIDTENKSLETPYPHAIAHGGGFIQGYSVTNSVEAVENSIENGFSWIELDLAFTTDGEIVMIHDWQSSASYYLGVAKNEAISYEAYQKCRVMEQFQTMTMQRLEEILLQHPQVRIITDTKENNISILTKLKKDYPEVAARVIPQIYDYGECRLVKSLGYDQVILTTYKMSGNLDGNQVAEFVKANQICAVTLSYDPVNTGVVQRLKDNGIVVYMHTVNSFTQLQDAVSKGAYGIYTDDLLPEEIETAQSQYYLVKTGGNHRDQRLDVQLTQIPLTLHMKGKDHTGYVNYAVGDVLVGTSHVNEDAKLDTSALDAGRYELKADVYNNLGTLVVSRSYFLWIDGNSVFLTGKQYGYLLDAIMPMNDFETEIAGSTDKVKEVLRQSLIAKAGSPVYYDNGKAGIYLSGASLLPVIKDQAGNLLLPLYDTAIRLGAGNVQMSSGKAMLINKGSVVYTAPVDGVSTWVDHENTTVINANLKIYRNKAMAGGNLYKAVLGRPYIQSGKVILLLPEGTVLTENLKSRVLSAAEQLYE